MAFSWMQIRRTRRIDRSSRVIIDNKETNERGMCKTKNGFLEVLLLLMSLVLLSMHSLNKEQIG